jgi:hypothetical protein
MSNVNINGISTLDSTNVSVSTTAVTFTLRPHAGMVPPRGLLLVRLNEAIPEGTTTTLPIQLSLEGVASTVTTFGGVDWTVEDFKGTGIYLLYYNRNLGILQVLTA